MAEDQNPQEPKFTPPDLDTLKKDSQSIFENLNDISKLITNITQIIKGVNHNNDE